MLECIVPLAPFQRFYNGIARSYATYQLTLLPATLDDLQRKFAIFLTKFVKKNRKFTPQGFALI
jgi:hypothetical protein